MNETPKVQAEKLLSTLLKGKEVHNIFAESMKKQLIFSGNTIEYWEGKFKIKIPTDNLTPDICKRIDMKILELNQEATFYYAIATAKAQLMKRGSEASFLAMFASLTQEYKNGNKKLPAAATLETLARIDNDDLESAVSIAEIEARFWKTILEDLATCRKLIENATINISVEMKALSNDRLLDHINRRTEGNNDE